MSRSTFRPVNVVMFNVGLLCVPCNVELFFFSIVLTCDCLFRYSASGRKNINKILLVIVIVNS